MNIENFAEWLQRQGHTVYQTKSSWWYDAGPRVFQAFPYNWLIDPSNQELRELMLKKGIIALRYSTGLDTKQGMVSYHVVLRNPYNLEMLRAQARNGVKRGLENCRIESIPFTRLADEGWDIQQDTLERQGRLLSMKQPQWQRICLAADGLPGFEAWGALVQDKLVASLITAQVGETCFVPYALSHRKYLNVHVNNALFYTVSCTLLDRAGVDEIFFTLHSLDAPESVDEFKFRMNFIPKPVRQRVVFHPFFQPFANALSHKILLSLIHHYPENPTIAKMEGMLRFYNLGKYPLDQQKWPECVSTYKENYL